MLKLKKRSNRRGYLLLESVAAVAIVGVGLAIILRSFASSLRASKISQEYFIASSILKGKMWSLEEEALRQNGLKEFDTTDPVPGTDYVLHVVSKRLSDSEPLNEIKAAVMWQNGARNEKIEVATYLKHEESE